MTLQRTCGGCGPTDENLSLIYLCQKCYGIADAKLAALKLRLSGDIDWDDIKKYGIYDRFGVPLATVLSVYETGPTYSMRTTSSGSMGTSQPAEDCKLKTLKIKELR